MALKPCLICGRITTGSKCPACRRASPYQSTAWRRLSLAVIQRDGKRCVRCGSGLFLSAHHVTPRSEGGADTLENLVALCRVCHGRITRQEEAERRRG